MEEAERCCPACQDNGCISSLKLCQINLTTAVFLCKKPSCPYPQGYTWIYVDRKLNLDECDSDSSDYDFEAEMASLKTVDRSSIASSNMSEILDIEPDALQSVNNNANSFNDTSCINSRKLSNLCNKTNTIKTIDMASDALQSSNNDVNNFLDISNTESIEKCNLYDKIDTVKTIEVQKSANSNTEVNNACSNVVENVVIDIIDTDKQLLNNSVKVSDITKTVKTVNSTTDLENKLKSELGYTIKIALPTVESSNVNNNNNNDDVLDIENMPIILAESEEGLSLIESTKTLDLTKESSNTINLESASIINVNAKTSDLTKESNNVMNLKSASIIDENAKNSDLNIESKNTTNLESVSVINDNAKYDNTPSRSRKTTGNQVFTPIKSKKIKFDKDSTVIAENVPEKQVAQKLPVDSSIKKQKNNVCDKTNSDAKKVLKCKKWNPFFNGQTQFVLKQEKERDTIKFPESVIKQVKYLSKRLSNGENITKTASKFDGFKFESKIIKKAETEDVKQTQIANNENEKVEPKVIKKEDIKFVKQLRSSSNGIKIKCESSDINKRNAKVTVLKKTLNKDKKIVADSASDNVLNNKETETLCDKTSSEKENSNAEIVNGAKEIKQVNAQDTELNDFFDNIDHYNPVDVPEAETDDLDWLTSLCQ